jgi:hypothetical protein
MSAHAHTPAAIAPQQGPTRRLNGRRGWIAAGVAVVLVVLAIEALGFITGPGPQGPVSSAYATNTQGLAAWAELAARAGQPVTELRQPLGRAHLDPRATVVVLDPDALLRADGQRLLAFVRGGGRLVVGGLDPDSALTALTPSPPRWTTSAQPDVTPTRGGEAALPGVASVRTAAGGSWTETQGDSVLLQDSDGNPILMARTVGAGEILLLADPSPVQNAYLASADNAQLALGLGARRPVVFVESVHGYGTSRGLAALPAGFKVALLGLGLAGLLWVLARGRRLGPPDALDPQPAPPRAAYVHAMALLLRRSGPPDELTPVLRDAAERELRGRPIAGRGLDEAQAAALEAKGSDPDVVALAGAVARLRGGPGR